MEYDVTRKEIRDAIEKMKNASTGSDGLFSVAWNEGWVPGDCKISKKGKRNEFKTYRGILTTQVKYKK